ncbi:2Fe-2S iron-sulfur cluster binding domain-containing protein [Sphingomonas sediminicola]|uniref:2Fe-2S iron-sulfur cluster binding domain-containing protein n=1 Tax=Sphingomonas sediminicola TaxID=386874 RepID=A0ABX6T7D3_9SPHN|nr:2Fe-2S iron-sulfur cluster-binding protein [Sphingomonas sediminicola]QNP44847.1 2Fe-2S iron-sulfur cluster binding domain-containing protein [Sphingomonas sediminicola]
MSAHFYPLKVAEIIPETAEANSIRFEIPTELGDAFAFKAGQHLTLKATIGGEEVRRNYSLCTAPAEQDWMVTVKRIAGGVFSNWVGDSLKAGDTVEVMPPHGSFTTEFAPAAKRHIVGIAGGSGITPVLSLLRTTLKEEPDSQFTLLYGNRDSSSIIFLEKLADLKDRYLGRLSLHHFLAEEEGDIDLFNGMLDRTRCDEAITALIGDPASVDAWFICGPGPMMDAAEGTLLERNVDNERIHIERFTADRPSAALAAEMAQLQTKAAGATMSVTLDGRTRRVAFTEANILDSARASGLPAPFACKAGVCATCRAKVTSGKVEMAARYGLTDEEVAAGYVLTCQSVPVGDGVAVDYDA